jgi:hypothetical protein
MKKLILILFMIFFSLGASAETSWADLFKQIVINPNFQLFKSHFFGGNATIKGGYNPGVEASFHEGLYTRWDRYYFDMNFSPDQKIGDVINTNVTFSPSATHDLQVQFARQFINKKDAYLAVPYFVGRIPFSAEQAVQKLNVGDFVMIEADLNLVADFSFLRELGVIAGLQLTGSEYYLISGQFYILVLRLPDNKIRLKLIAVHKNENGGSLNLGYADTLKIFHINFVDNAITRVLDLNPVSLQYTKGSNNLFMVDYILDLKKKEVAEAYDQLLRKATDLENGILANPLQNRDKIKSKLILDLLPVDRLARKDQRLDESHRGVSRSFKGTVDEKYRSGQFHLGISIAQILSRTDQTQNKIDEIDLSGRESKHELDFFQKRMEGGYLFQFFNVRRDLRMTSLYDLDDHWQKQNPADWMMSLERRDANFSFSKFQRVQSDLQRVIPISLYNQIDFSGWKISSDPTKQNVATRYQVTIHPQGLAAIAPLTRQEIFDRYIAYLKEIPVSDLNHRRIVPDQFYTSPDLYVRYFGYDVDLIAKKLEKVFATATSGNDKLATLMELGRNALFMQTGSRFIIDLIPQEQWPDLIHVYFEMEDDFSTKVSFAFGKTPPSELFEKMLYLQKLLNGDGIDFRLESENLKLAESLHLESKIHPSFF